MDRNIAACRQRAQELKDKRLDARGLQEMLGLYWPYHASCVVEITAEDESDDLTRFIEELERGGAS